MPSIGAEIYLPLRANDARIVLGRLYLAKIYGKWCVDYFGKQWYGWNFNGRFDAGTQFDSKGWEALYEFKETE